MTFRGNPFAAIQSESRKWNDIFCRSDLVPSYRVLQRFLFHTENFPRRAFPSCPLSHYTSLL
jgi:hypothetical protein